MGGTSSSQQTQNSVTSPWAPAQPALQGILGQLQGMNSNTLSPNALNAINTIAWNGQNANQFTPAINNVTSSLLSGGGALNQVGNVQNAFNQYNANTGGLANNTDYNPLNTPGLKDSLNYLQNQIATGINGQFAAAGRDMSPANTQALAYGETSGLAPLLTSQYNQNIQNQQAAAGNLYNAGNTNAGILSGLQQQYLTNQLGGVNNVANGLNAQNAGAQATFGATQLPFQTQAQNLGLLANIGVPIAGLGGQSTGTSSGTNTMSGAQEFATILGGLGSLFGGRR